ncbi:hypothetical protein BGW80DRAFT_1436138 [Lactifluus volemus]|nr:hypothetical protein BGW80DRAFT_1436138 [Lactifluus volemus]
MLPHSSLQSARSDGSLTNNSQTTPPSPLTDSSSVPAFFSSESTPYTELTSLTSDVSNLSLGTVKEPVLTEPSPVTWPYSHDTALDDIPGISYALDLFLKSLMVESEEYCHRSDPKKERLYFATGFGLIQCVKALMSYEDDDLLSAIGDIKHGNAIAIEHRKKAASLPFRLAGYVTGSSGSNWVKSMTAVERHAELVYAESLYLGPIGIVYSGDWLAFIKEARPRQTQHAVDHAIFRQLGKYIDQMDAEAQARGEGPEDKSIDVHFRSGVYLGVGMSHIVLSLMPTRLATLVELFGYKGNRHLGLALLQRAGGWTKESSVPSVSQENEGVRRSICDMTLLIFHLFLSSFSHDGVDILMAQKIVDWNLKRYPEGNPARPRYCLLSKAMSVQTQYRNLHHISFWEMASSHLALWQVEDSLKCWRSLHKESTWSKAVYAYGVAALLIQLGTEAGKAEGLQLMKEIPKLRQRIAGKSIPLEKRTVTSLGLELAYVFHAVARAPRSVIAARMLPLVDSALASLKRHEDAPQTYGNGTGFWDDWCLARHLEGACLRYIAYPDPDALLDPDEVVPIPQEEAAHRSGAAFRAVFENGPNIELEHHIVYHSHYEYGRLLACMGDKEGARAQFDLVLSGKPLEVNAAGRKNDLHMRTNAALESLDVDKQL